MSNIVFLNQARKMLTDDYKSKHTAEYNSWLAAHKNSWMQPHVIVPYPPFVISGALAPFNATVTAPSEEDIVAKALELYQLANPVPVRREVVEKSEAEAVSTQRVDTVSISEVAEVDDPVIEVEKSAEILIDKLLVTPVIQSPIKEVAEPTSDDITSEVKVKPFVDGIYKIYQTGESEPIDPSERFTVFTAMEEALKVVPQPTEELAKVTKPGKILPSVLEKLQAMTTKWSTTGETNV